MECSLCGKVVFITGAASGIGRAAAELWGAEGARLFLTDVDKQALEEVERSVSASGGEVASSVVDVSVSAQVRRAVDECVARYGRIDCCFNNAGVSSPLAPIPDFPEEVFDRVVRINEYGCFYVLKYVMGVMRDQESGAIVNTASTSGIRGIPEYPAYCASKHAVIGLTRAAALEGIRYGVRVNALAPGMTATPMNDEWDKLANPEHPEENRAAYSAKLPVGRYAEPSEQAAAAGFLLSDAASYIAGEVVNVDGAVTTGF